MTGNSAVSDNHNSGMGGLFMKKVKSRKGKKNLKIDVSASLNHNTKQSPSSYDNFRAAHKLQNFLPPILKL
jgi:hypothetical protein